MELAKLTLASVSDQVRDATRVESENAPFGRSLEGSSWPRRWSASLAHAIHFLVSLPASESARLALLIGDALLLLVALAAALPAAAIITGREGCGLILGAFALAFPLNRSFSPGFVDSAAGALACMAASLGGLIMALQAPRRRWGLLSGAALGIAFAWDPLAALSALVPAVVTLIWFLIRPTPSLPRHFCLGFFLALGSLLVLSSRLDPAGFAQLPGGLAPDSLADLRLAKSQSSVFAPTIWELASSPAGVRQVLLASLPAIVLVSLLGLAVRRGLRLAPVNWITIGFAACATLHALACPRLVSVAQLWSAGAVVMILHKLKSQAGGSRAPVRIVAVSAGLLSFILGLGLATPIHLPGSVPLLTQDEVRAVVLQDLSRWLRMQSGAATKVILAPPLTSMTLDFYCAGDIVASLSRRNQAGLQAAATAFLANSFSGASQPVFDRGVTHIVLPAWDTYFDEKALESGLMRDNVTVTFLRALRLPPWLRALPYHAPTVQGSDANLLLVLEVVDFQSEVLAYTRLTDYFLEMGELGKASAVAKELERFPSEWPAWVARAHVNWETGRRDAALTALAEALQRFRSSGENDTPLDRLVSLGIALARGRKLKEAADLARLIAERLTSESLLLLTDGAAINLQKLLAMTGARPSDRDAREKLAVRIESAGRMAE